MENNQVADSQNNPPLLESKAVPIEKENPTDIDSSSCQFYKMLNAKIQPQIELEYKQIPYLNQLMSTPEQEAPKALGSVPEDRVNLKILLEEKKNEDNEKNEEENQKDEQEIPSLIDDLSESSHIIKIPKEFLPNQTPQKLMNQTKKINYSTYSIRKHKPKIYNPQLLNEANKAIGKPQKLKKNALTQSHQESHSSKKQKNMFIQHNSNRKIASYSDIKLSLQYLKSVNCFDADELCKNRIFSMKCYTPICFWFAFCANYFPLGLLFQMSSQLIENLSEYLGKINFPIQIRIKKQKNFGTDYYSEDYKNSLITYKQKYDREDDQFLLELKTKTQTNDVKTLDQLIECYEQELQIQTDKNQANLLCLEKKIEIERDTFFSQFKSPSTNYNDILIDLSSLAEQEKEYITYLETRQQQQIIKDNSEYQQKLQLQNVNPENQQQTSKGTSRHCNQRNLINIDDITCQICNDGDYSDDNQIVLCSKCNISVHQKCYGLLIVPKEAWICDLCKQFGKSGRALRCPLCTRKGGAMKQTKFELEQLPFLENLNPQFWKKYKETKKFKLEEVEEIIVGNLFL